jgi:hypothetical protein
MKAHRQITHKLIDLNQRIYNHHMLFSEIIKFRGKTFRRFDNKFFWVLEQVK